MSKPKIAGIGVGVVLIAVIIGWVSTAPYLSNQGLGRMPGVFIGGVDTPVPDDFTELNETVRGPLIMKLAGFPPFVNYLSWVGTPDGVITATRPDDGYWERRILSRGGDGYLRIGDQTFSMTATPITDETERLAMMAQWAAKSGGRTLDEPAYPGAEPLRDWKVFFWTAK